MDNAKKNLANEKSDLIVEDVTSKDFEVIANENTFENKVDASEANKADGGEAQNKKNEQAEEQVIKSAEKETKEEILAKEKVDSPKNPPIGLTFRYDEFLKGRDKTYNKHMEEVSKADGATKNVLDSGKEALESLEYTKRIFSEVVNDCNEKIKQVKKDMEKSNNYHNPKKKKKSGCTIM